MDRVYDLTNDPYEIKNLVKETVLTDKLDAELQQLIKDVKYTIPVDANPRSEPNPPAKNKPSKGDT